MKEVIKALNVKIGVSFSSIRREEEGLFRGRPFCLEGVPFKVSSLSFCFFVFLLGWGLRASSIYFSSFLHNILEESTFRVFMFLISV